jgi:hypothetical protein
VTDFVTRSPGRPGRVGGWCDSDETSPHHLCRLRIRRSTGRTWLGRPYVTGVGRLRGHSRPLPPTPRPGDRPGARSLGGESLVVAVVQFGADVRPVMELGHDPCLRFLSLNGCGGSGDGWVADVQTKFGVGSCTPDRLASRAGSGALTSSLNRVSTCALLMEDQLRVRIAAGCHVRAGLLVEPPPG